MSTPEEKQLLLYRLLGVGLVAGSTRWQVTNSNSDLDLIFQELPQEVYGNPAWPYDRSFEALQSTQDDIIEQTKDGLLLRPFTILGIVLHINIVPVNRDFQAHVTACKALDQVEREHLFDKKVRNLLYEVAKNVYKDTHPN